MLYEVITLGLSGGQQQRLCIARAIAVEPEILLMDEPTSALDPISTAKIEELIRELEKDYTILIVTHNMQQAARISDYTAFFYQGIVEEFDKTETVITSYSIHYTKLYDAYDQKDAAGFIKINALRLKLLAARNKRVGN